VLYSKLPQNAAADSDPLALENGTKNFRESSVHIWHIYLK